MRIGQEKQDQDQSHGQGKNELESGHGPKLDLEMILNQDGIFTWTRTGPGAELGYEPGSGFEHEQGQDED